MGSDVAASSPRATGPFSSKAQNIEDALATTKMGPVQKAKTGWMPFGLPGGTTCPGSEVAGTTPEIRMDKLAKPVQRVYSNRARWVAPSRKHWLAESARHAPGLTFVGMMGGAFVGGSIIVKMLGGPRNGTSKHDQQSSQTATASARLNALRCMTPQASRRPSTGNGKNTIESSSWEKLQFVRASPAYQFLRGVTSDS